MKVTEANLKNHFHKNGVHEDVIEALEGRGFFSKIVNGLKHAGKLHAGILTAGKMSKSTIKFGKPTKRVRGAKLSAGKLSAGKLSGGKEEKHYCECESDSEDGGYMSAGKLKKKKELPGLLKDYEKQVLAYKKKRDTTTKKAMMAICKKESRPKRELPPALKMHQKKVMEYKEKHNVTLKEAMIALKKKRKKNEGK